MTMTEEAPVAAGPPDADSGGKKSKKGKAKKDKAKGGRSNLVPALVLAAGIAAGGYFMGGSPADSTPAVVEVEPEIVAGEVVELDSLTVNLANGRFVRVGVAVLTSEDYEPLEGDDGWRFPPGHESRLRDQLIANFAGRDVAGVTGHENLELVKAELLERANRVLDGHAIEVYFTDLVVQ